VIFITNGKLCKSHAFILVVCITLMIMTLSVVSAADTNSTDKSSSSPIKKSTNTTNLKGASATKSSSASCTLFKIRLISPRIQLHYRLITSLLVLIVQMELY